ncbi:hypothetical protein LTR56_024857 [Elasticomyces elasticus]|nr:hypothetical protein LTR22_026932 [Elasticomyces elasticus]KAK3618139.1 hypothetical protein LTR56_024857 [Elasticomyces elasticus]KAK4917550.1 hypothetical protein LTR49_014636 [Elasticomyces elasticus]KAK5756326.1 hypothetical protein LTS12_013515 [Elasticomyces elasticus]
MPSYRLPRKSTAHRIAAIALYRALLSSCRALAAVEGPSCNELQNIIRNRFKQARHEQSTRRLRLAFEAGYEAIDHLDAAVAGDVPSHDYILDLLAKAPTKVKQAPPVAITQETVKDLKRSLQPQYSTPRSSLFDRPLPLSQLSGSRHIPVLYNAQGMPVLRLSKPQPESLSGLTEELEMARAEDKWDEIVQQYDRGQRRARGENVWAYEVYEARNEVMGKLSDEKWKNQVMAEKMQAVVDRETEQVKLEREQSMRKAEA